MVKHFETLWEESETLQSNETIENVLNNLNEIMNKLNNPNEDKSVLIGKMLFYCSYLSNVFKINVYSALLQQMQEHRMDLLDPT